MSRAWIAYYPGDYLRDTLHLTTEQHGAYFLLLNHCWQHDAIPVDETERAAIVRLPLAEWRKIKGPVEKFFRADGTQKRASDEIAKTDQKIMQRALAGKKGGQRSGITRAIARGHEAKPKQMVSKIQSHMEPNQETKMNSSPTNHISKLSSSLSSELREVKKPSELSRHDLDALYAAKRPATEAA